MIQAKPRPGRAWVWLQLAVAWLPLWALFAAIIVIVHGLPLANATIGSLRMVAPGALLGAVVYRFAQRTPWPYPFRLRFVGIHVLAALLYALAWYGAVSLIDSALTGRMQFSLGPGYGLFLITGVWLYIVVAIVAYANLAAQRTARIEANAARMQLDALRAQLHPHFLFNALHTVVQLIPRDPRAATRAAEELAGTLRHVIEEHRDQISVREEWTFVERYLGLERLRFGARLEVRAAIDDAARDALLPSFALQTLVENAVRHGAAPRVEPTTISIAAQLSGDLLTVSVSDDGSGAAPGALEAAAGTGLRRLRERMAWLYGDGARLDVTSAPGAGLRATLQIPQQDAAAHSDG